jgi:hypothetical protein
VSTTARLLIFTASIESACSSVCVCVLIVYMPVCAIIYTFYIQGRLPSDARGDSFRKDRDPNRVYISYIKYAIYSTYML